MIIKSDGQGAYLSGDLAYYLDKRERGFDRCFIMLGADHHGYVGRMMAMCAAFGDEPGKNLEILIGQMVNLLRDGAAAADVQAGRHRRHDRRPGRRDRRRRVPLRAGPLQLRLQHRPRPRPVGQGSPTTTRSTTCSTPTPGSSGSCATPPTSASSRSTDDFDPACSPTRRRASCCGRSPSSRGWSPAPPSCASRTGSPATSRTPPASYHRFYDNCRVLPEGDEEASDLHRARLVLVAATRTVLANGLRLLGVSAPGADVAR